jgi:hypothetical protein
VRIDDAEPRFADTIPGRPHAFVARRFDFPSAPFAGDDAHFRGVRVLVLEVGEASLQSRFAVPHVALEAVGDVDRHSDV